MIPSKIFSLLNTIDLAPVPAEKKDAGKKDNVLQGLTERVFRRPQNGCFIAFVLLEMASLRT
jgi:hypothetical protein